MFIPAFCGWQITKFPVSTKLAMSYLNEFGHALGLIHEHQSPTVKVNWNKPFVYWYFWEYHRWAKADVDRTVFQEFKTTTTQYSSLDKLSIMATTFHRNSRKMGKDFL